MSNEDLARALADLDAGRAPVPEDDEIYVGGGPYLKIGAEFLGHFVRLGGLEPHHTVLDIGSGIGRITSGLSRYLNDEGRYIGIEPVKAGVEWCRKAYADRPNFRFEWVDLYNELYNPEGKVLSTQYRFPVESGSVDLVILTSVFTHLYEGEIAAYFTEIARVLKPGGRMVATAYLFAGDKPREVTAPHLQFNSSDPDYPHRWHVEGMQPLSAVCYSQSYFARLAERRTGRAPQIFTGRWQGGDGPTFQDLVLL
jgi:SAM-dependent methyltransferase